MEPSPTRLRQIALVSPDLEKATHLLTHIIGTSVIYQDPLVAQWGLKNILVPIGGDILEIVTPLQHPSPTIPASRTLTKSGEGGYMLILQTSNALSRKEHLISNDLAKVIFEHKFEGGSCIQYHPKLIPGGVIPELDEHDGDMGVKERFSRWHAVDGAGSGVVEREMRIVGGLWLKGVVLGVGDVDVDVAARKWEELLGVKRGGRGWNGFTNGKLWFVKDGNEGIREIVIGVVGRESVGGILERARIEGLVVRDDLVEMIGVRWRFVLVDEEGKLIQNRSKL